MSRGRIYASLLAILALVSVVTAVTDASVFGGAVKAGQRTKRKVVHALKAPTQANPASGVHAESSPVLTWSAVRGAAEYEWQVSAESTFHSQVVQRAIGRGTPRTHNLAATLPDNVTDGTYYWRVRGVSSGGKAGAWSRARTFIKHWTATATLLAPDDQASIQWPSKPLVMRWSAVPHAYEYLVQIATDREFADVVYGSAKSLVKTTGTAIAFPATLPTGRYFWRVTPVDNEGHRGVASESRSFTWSWPTRMASTYVRNVNPNFGTYEPQFNWEAVPGAARYELQVSSAEGFPAGSMWCCEREPQTVGTALAPTAELNNNNEYYWRVRALDASGHAGEWNEGPIFKRNFDEVTPTVPGLNLITTDGSVVTPPAPGLPLETREPIVTWSQVPGAASYEVQIAPYEAGCNWLSPNRAEIQTATLAWTPVVASGHVGPGEWPSPQPPLNHSLTPGTSYCVRVLAEAGTDALGKNVITRWTYVGGEGNPAFKYLAQPAPGAPEVPFTTRSSDYRLPAQSAASPSVTVDSECTQGRCPRTPLFTWSRVPGASEYYVVVSRDKNFTNVVDVAKTVIPAYAPPLHGAEPLDDETEAYYWAVMPVKEGKGEVEPLEDSPHSFNKSSIAPEVLAPNGIVEGQPTLSWSPAEGAIDYTVQVSQNSTFKSLVDEVQTDSTAFTPTKTYPAGEPLYWRVRANDANQSKGLSGLSWSQPLQFTRILPTPVPSASNPTSSEVLPVLSWLPAPGAVSYEFSLEQPDGTRVEYTTASVSTTPTAWAGAGVWRWKVRGLYPSTGATTVPGPFSAQQPLVHTTLAPPGAIGEKSGDRVVIHWSPEAYAKQYEVSVSTTETFRTSLETKRIYTTSWAPNISFATKANRGTLYWRVAAIDLKGNAGAYSTGRFVPPRRKCKSAKRRTGKCPRKH